MDPSTVSDNGKKMNDVLAAVRDLHRDCSRLIRDVDDWMSERKWHRFGDDDTAVRFSADLKKGLFMPEYIYRRWTHGKHSEASRVRGVFIWLFDKSKPKHGCLSVPTLIASDLNYSQQISFKNGHWDPYFVLCDLPPGVVMNQAAKVWWKADTIQEISGAVIANPLFALTSADQVEQMFTMLSTKLDLQEKATDVIIG